MKDRWTDGWIDVRNRQDNGERAPPQVFPPRLLLFADAVCVFFGALWAWCYSLSVKVPSCLRLFRRSLFFPGLAVWYPVNLLSKTKTGGQLIALTSRSKWTRPDLISTSGECSLFFFCLLVLTIDHHRGNGGGGWMTLTEAWRLKSGFSSRHFLLLGSRDSEDCFAQRKDKELPQKTATVSLHWIFVTTCQEIMFCNLQLWLWGAGSGVQLEEGDFVIFLTRWVKIKIFSS